MIIYKKKIPLNYKAEDYLNRREAPRQNRLQFHIKLYFSCRFAAFESKI